MLATTVKNAKNRRCPVHFCKQITPASLQNLEREFIHLKH